ncbi:hypothetical protein OAU50_04455 [Planctomycetota bacterium]|nr:hypothetical protein [Planctomycetota bacterium]
MKLFPDQQTKTPTKVVSQIGLGSWEEERTPSELFDLAEQFVSLGEWNRDKLIASGRTDFEQMAVELALRPRQAKELLNGVTATSVKEPDGKTGRQWLENNKVKFELLLDQLASIDFSVEVYFDGAMDKHRFALKKAKIDSYILSSQFLRDVLHRVPEAAAELAEGIGDVAGSTLKGVSKGLGTYGTAIALGILLLALGVPMRRRK